MTRHGERLVAPLLEEVRGRDAAQVVMWLWDQGLMNVRSLECRAIRSRVERLVGEGRGRVRAMEQAAADFCCSYEKVRDIIYERRK